MRCLFRSLRVVDAVAQRRCYVGRSKSDFDRWSEALRVALAGSARL